MGPAFDTLIFFFFFLVRLGKSPSFKQGEGKEKRERRETLVPCPLFLSFFSPSVSPAPLATKEREGVWDERDFGEREREAEEEGVPS